MNILELPSDLWRAIALELDYTDISRLCKTSILFNKKICADDSFWRNKWNKDFPGFRLIPEFANAREYYKIIRKQLRETPNTVPNIIRKDALDSYTVINGAAKHGRDVFNSTCDAFYHLCNDPSTWINILTIFYPHIRGNYNNYKTKYYPTFSWREFYFRIVNTPSLMQTGFK